uniref:Kelch-like family member 10 n=2 Tax=Iconisemion striatum TaxID=60296 RepID=A0A1A7WY29_9TELE
MDPEYIQVHVLENDLVNNDEGADHQRGVQGGRHKVTWTAGSLFTQWSPPEERMYELSFMSAKIMKVIIDYVYTGSLDLTDDNVQELLEAVVFINYEGLLKACSSFLTTWLSADNCINTRKLTFTFYFPKLCTSAYSYILEHFEEVSLCNFPGAVNDGTKNHHRQRQTDGETGENCL